MTLAITTPPAAEVVSIADFRAHAGQDGGAADDIFVARLIKAVTAWLSGPNGWLGRSLVEQTLTLTVPLGVAGYYPGDAGRAVEPGMMGLVLPRPPLIEVEAVAILDATGAPVTVPPEGYTTSVGPDGLPRLMFTPAFRAPLLPAGPAFLRVVYRAGYGPAGEDVDEGIRHALLMTVMRLYAGRGDPTMSLQSDPMAADFFAPYRVWTAL